MIANEIANDKKVQNWMELRTQ